MSGSPEQPALVLCSTPDCGTKTNQPVEIAGKFFCRVCAFRRARKGKRGRPRPSLWDT